MTTPERLRRRQRRESFFIGILALALVGGFLYFRAQDAQQDECLSGFIKNQTETSAVRSGLVEDESQATRAIIIGVFTAETRPQVQQAFEDYRSALGVIDKARKENPVKGFPEGLCES